MTGKEKAEAIAEAQPVMQPPKMRDHRTIRKVKCESMDPRSQGEGEWNKHIVSGKE